MRYQLEPRYRKYVQGYGFLSFLRKCRDKYGKKWIQQKNKERGIDAAKTSFKQ